MPALLGAALSAKPSRVAFSVPTSRGLRGLANKVAWGLEAFLTRLQKDACQGYVHSVDDIERRSPPRASAAQHRLDLPLVHRRRDGAATSTE